MNLYAQIFATIAITTMVLSYLSVSKKKYLLFQILCNIFYAIQFFLLNAFSASGISMLTIFKSFAFYKYEGKNNKIPVYVLILFEIITIIFGIYIYTNFRSILPIILSCLFTYGTWQKNLKITYAIGTLVSIAWIFYDFIVGAYVALIGCVFELIASIIGLTRLFKLDKKRGKCI